MFYEYIYICVIWLYIYICLLMSVSWYVCNYKVTASNYLNSVYIYIDTGGTKVALVELPTVNMFGFFFCTPFPRRILAWSFVVPRSHFHPPKALKSYIYIIHLKEGNNWPTTPATQNGLENVIRSWPRWMFCKVFKKHKLCSSLSIYMYIYIYIHIYIYKYCVQKTIFEII